MPRTPPLSADPMISVTVRPFFGSRSSVPHAVSNLALTPGTVRSAGAENELTVPANAESVVLGLIWTQRERFPSYQATIRKIDEDESFTIPNLQLDSGNIIRLRLPSRLLTRGLYRIEASGVGADGATGPVDEYQFQVNR